MRCVARAERAGDIAEIVDLGLDGVIERSWQTTDDGDPSHARLVFIEEDVPHAVGRLCPTDNVTELIVDPRGVAACATQRT